MKKLPILYESIHLFDWSSIFDIICILSCHIYSPLFNARAGMCCHQQASAKHILCKHKDSRRPSSWREKEITRTVEEATAIIEGVSHPV